MLGVSFAPLAFTPSDSKQTAPSAASSQQHPRSITATKGVLLTCRLVRGGAAVAEMQLQHGLQGSTLLLLLLRKLLGAGFVLRVHRVWQAGEVPASDACRPGDRTTCSYT